MDCPIVLTRVHLDIRQALTLSFAVCSHKGTISYKLVLYITRDVNASFVLPVDKSIRIVITFRARVAGVNAFVRRSRRRRNV